MVFSQQFEKIKTQKGFIAALDQSGGSTPKALRLYGVEEDRYNNEEEMYDFIHEMRTRIITDEKFGGDRILGAILFEMTMNKNIEGIPTAQYLWEEKNIVPFLKIDVGMHEEENGVQLMKEIPNLESRLTDAKEKLVFGTKMRSVIQWANKKGITELVAQQFAFGKEIISAGLIPIIEPEVNIKNTDKGECEELLRVQLLKNLDILKSDQFVILKLTLPQKENIYSQCINHSQVLKVVALSGGYSREEANSRLSKNKGMIASFSRALTEGLSDSQTDKEFSDTIDNSIETIFQASNT